jgi:hypothetical protein
VDDISDRGANRPRQETIRTNSSQEESKLCAPQLNNPARRTATNDVTFSSAALSLVPADENQL